jgi:hypothetical protein
MSQDRSGPADEESRLPREASTEGSRPTADAGTEGGTGLPPSAEQTKESEGLTTLEEDEQARPEGREGARYDRLLEKRRSKGLTDEEADELGRLIAESEGTTWSSARSLKAEAEKTEG